jgi:glycosyltransferase involved in cell wall biosynthesis
MPRLVIVEFSFYPETTAVSQLLGDLVFRLRAEHPDWSIRVLAGGIWEDRFEYSRWCKGVRVHRFFPPWVGGRGGISKAIRYLWYGLAIFLLVPVFSHDATVVCLTTPPFLGAIVSSTLSRSRSRFIYYIQDLYPELLFDLGYLRVPWLIRRLQQVQNRTYRKAAKVITIGEDMKERILASYKRIRDIEIVPNWGFQVAPSPTPRSGLHLVYSGNAGLAHSFELLFQLAMSLKTWDGICYTFRGGGVQFENIRKRFSVIGEQRARFCGYSAREDVVTNLQEASVLVISQRNELLGDLLPSKFSTYLSVGRPILFIGPRQSEIGRVLMKNDIGFVLEATRDLETCIQWLDSLRKTTDLRDAMGGRASQVYQDHYSFDLAFNQFRNVMRGPSV